MPMPDIFLLELICAVIVFTKINEKGRWTLCVITHISILEQESQRLAFNSILFDVLAVEFSVESKNINRFAGERDDFF